MPLEWSDPQPPKEGGSPYDHVTAETPLGTITIEWKSWKKYDSPVCILPWDECITGHTLDDAKSQVQSAWDQMVDRMARNRTSP